MATKQTKKAKAKEERLEDILWSCRNHLRGKADMFIQCAKLVEAHGGNTKIDYETALAEANAKAGELLARQGENAARLKAAFAALGAEIPCGGAAVGSRVPRDRETRRKVK